MLTMLPRLRSLKSLAASRDMSMTPVTLVAKTASKLPRSWSISSLSTPMPALFIRTSRSPSFSLTSRKVRIMSASFATSACIPTTTSERAASANRSASRPVIATRAPAWANTWAAARPMPLDPPVIRTTAFFKSMCSMVIVLFPAQVRQVFFVFAEILEHIGVRQKFVRNLYREGLGVHLRIVKSYLVIQVSEIAAPEALHDAEGFAMGVAHGIERSLVIETGRFDDQGVALPVPRRVTIERRKVDLFRKLAAVSVDLPVEVAGLVHNHCQPRGLTDLDRLGEEATERKPKYETRGARIAQGRTSWVPAHPFDGLRTHRRFFGFKIEEDVAAIFMLRADLHSRHTHLNRLIDDTAIEPPHLCRGCRLVHPYAPAVRRASRVRRPGRSEISFAIGRARSSGLAKVQPLRMHGNR